MTDRRIAQRFSVLATLEDSKLGTLFLTRDDERGGHALLLLLGSAVQADDATLAAIAADTAPDTLPTTAWGRGEDGVWLAVAAPASVAEPCTLEQVIKRRDKLELVHILRAAVALARGIGHLGALEHRHLDIQPGRVWLPAGTLTSGTPLLFGAGWWRLLPAYQTNAAADAFYGNPEYLAAELCKGQAATATTDVYGAATTIWALAAGKPPFPSNQPLMALKRQAVEKPLRLDLVKPGLAGVKDLQALLADALDKDPTRRPTPASWRTAVEALAGQKAPEALVKEVATASVQTAPAALTAETIHLSASVMAAAVAASATELASAAEPAPTAIPTDLPQNPAETVAESAVLDSLPSSAPADGDDGIDLEVGDGETDESGAPRSGKRRRERRERQTVAGIGIAAALAERNLEEQAAGNSPTPTLVGLKPEPKSAPALDGGMLRSTPPANRPGSGAVTSQMAAVPAGVPKRPESGSSPKVVIKGQQPSDAASGMTDRVRAEIAQGAFFEEDVAPAAPADLADLVPPTPPAEKVNRKALFSILGFAALMLGVSTWMSTRQPTPEPKAPAEEPPAQAPEEDVVAAPEDVSAAEDVTAAAAPPAVVTPVDAAPAADAAVAVAAAEVDAGSPAAAPDAVVAAAPDAAVTAAPAVAPPAAVPAAPKGPANAQVQKLVAEGRSALSTKDPVTALARAKEALALDAGNAPAALLREEASRAVDAAVAEAKASEAKAAAEQAAKNRMDAAKAKADSERISKAEAAKRAVAEKAEAKRAAAEKKNEKVAAARRAKEAAAAKVAAAKAAKAAKAREKKAKAKASRQKAAPAENPAPAPKATPAAKPTAAPAAAPKPAAKAEEAGSGSSEAAKFAALAQKASKAKLKVLYLQKALKLDPNNGGYKSQLKSAEEQLKTEAP